MSESACRVRLAGDAESSELPFRILALVDAGAALETPYGERRPRPYHADLPGACGAGVEIDTLCDGLPARGWLSLRDAAGWSDAAIITALPALAALEQALRARRAETDAVATALLARRLDQALAQVRALPAVRRLEGVWRSLALVAAHAGEGVELAVLSATRSEIEQDLDEAASPAGSALHRLLVDAEFGQHGGRPWGLVLSDLRCDGSPRSVALLRRCAAVCARAGAPLLSEADPRLLGLSEWAGLSGMSDPAAALAGPDRSAWRSWRSQSDARHAVVAGPPPLLRAALTPGDRPLAGLAGAVVAARIAASMSATGWPSAAAGAGPLPGPAIPAGPALDDCELSPPCPCLIDEEQARALAACGILPLRATRRAPGWDLPQLPTVYAAGDELQRQLPLVLLADRLAHHLRVEARERLGDHLDPGGLERGLADWLGARTADGAVADPVVRARRPLLGATVRVEAVPGRPGWARVAVRVRPHLAGAATAIELRLDELLAAVA
jgi:type VI secretion system protein ImpC